MRPLTSFILASPALIERNWWELSFVPDDGARTSIVLEAVNVTLPRLTL